MAATANPVDQLWAPVSTEGAPAAVMVAAAYPGDQLEAEGSPGMGLASNGGSGAARRAFMDAPAIREVPSVLYTAFGPCKARESCCGKGQGGKF